MMNKVVVRGCSILRIVELWRFKACEVKKVDEEDHLSFFKAVIRFFGCGEEWYHCH